MRWKQHSAVSATTARNYPQLCAFGETTVHWRSNLLAWLIGSFLTTSAISSIPFLDVTNSLLGRIDFRTAWGGRFELGASMSPIVMKRKTLLELWAAQTTSTADILVQNNHTRTHTQTLKWDMRRREASLGWKRKQWQARKCSASARKKEAQHLLSPDVKCDAPSCTQRRKYTTHDVTKKKNLYWFFFFSFPLQFRNLKQPHHA